MDQYGGLLAGLPFGVLLARDFRFIIVVVAEVRGTDIMPAALVADDMNQVRPAQPDLLVEAQLIQLPQMLADHDATPFGFRNRRWREKGIRAYRTIIATVGDSPPIFGVRRLVAALGGDGRDAIELGTKCQRSRPSGSADDGSAVMMNGDRCLRAALIQKL